MSVIRTWIVGILHKNLIIERRYRYYLVIDSFQGKCGSNNDNMANISSTLKVRVGFIDAAIF